MGRGIREAKEGIPEERERERTDREPGGQAQHVPLTHPSQLPILPAIFAQV